MEQFEFHKPISQLFGALRSYFSECESFTCRSFRTTEQNPLFQKHYICGITLYHSTANHTHYLLQKWSLRIHFFCANHNSSELTLVLVVFQRSHLPVIPTRDSTKLPVIVCTCACARGQLPAKMTLPVVLCFRTTSRRLNLENLRNSNFLHESLLAGQIWNRNS